MKCLDGAHGGKDGLFSGILSVPRVLGQDVAYHVSREVLPACNTYEKGWLWRTGRKMRPALEHAVQRKKKLYF
ncbi:hypothetical protein HZA98_04230 [Candidatus Woesearchaeota archaeon]|nr:hypothetical protein [Candidatus Woesearchaeota archaeon]